MEGIRYEANRLKGAVADAYTAISSKGVTVPSTAKSDDLASLIMSIEAVEKPPAYWQAELATKTAEINSALEAAGDNRAAFLWYTDAHWKSNYGQSPTLLKYLSKNTGIKKTFFGGDIAVDASGEIDILRAWQELVSDIPNHHSVIGNHDNQVSELPTAQDRADFFFGPELTGDVVFGTDATNGKNYYYIDNHIEQTRYICMSTGRMWVYADEAQWCIDVLNSTPSGWHIVIVSHLWLDNNYASTGTVINTTPPDYIQFLLDVFDAYNYRESGTTSKHSLPYDFSNAAAKIEFIIGGHVHQDYDFTTANGIPVILTECDAWQERDDVSVAIKGTTTENCVYAVVADYAERIVKVINVGRGDSREIDLSGDRPAYTNLLPTAIGFDGKIVDGIGYKNGARYSTSSKAFSSATGWDASGLIPCARGDVVRLKNIRMFYTAEYEATYGDRGRITYFDESFATINQTKLNELAESGGDLNLVYDTDGNIIQFTIPSWASLANIKYFGICAQDINETSIITVNEPIDGESTDDAVPSYTNQLSKSLALDGSGIFGEDYNGDGIADGYKINTRTSSSGDTAATGWCVTGLIPAKAGDIIRFKNMEYFDISGDGGSTPRTTFFVYDSAFNKLSNASHNPNSLPGTHFAPIYGDNGDVIQLTVPNWGGTYIRLCCGNLNENSIITVNEDIT